MIESFHVIKVADTQIWVSSEVRKEFEHWFHNLDLPNDRYATITIQDIYDAEVLIVADALNYIYESTPSVRAASKAHDKEFNSGEVPGVD
jgi:hypothetical protein